MTEAEVQLWQLSSSSSLAITAQLHQQRSNLQQFQLRQPCSLAPLQPCSLAALQPCSRAALQPCSLTALQHHSAAWQPQATALQLYSLAVLRSNEKPQNLRYQQQPYSPATNQKSQCPARKEALQLQAHVTCLYYMYRHHQHQNVLQCCIWYSRDSLQGLQ